MLHVIEQASTNLGRRGRRNPYQHRLADPRLQQFDPLRDGRLRQTQDLGSPFEAGLFDHCGEGGEQFIVEHQFS